MVDLARRLAAEALGTALLVATVVGSGIMADRLTDDVALALLGNTLPTGAILVVLITILGPISGAHFNPAVTLVFALRGEIDRARRCRATWSRRSPAAIAGTLARACHVRAADPRDVGTTVRTGAGQWIAEAVAAFGLVFTILPACAPARTRSPGWSGSTSPPPTGSRPRPRSPIRRWRSPAPSPTRSPASGRSTCRASSLPRSPARLLAMALAGWLLAEPRGTTE